jgi:hypothetical protein
MTKRNSYRSKDIPSQLIDAKRLAKIIEKNFVEISPRMEQDVADFWGGHNKSLEDSLRSIRRYARTEQRKVPVEMGPELLAALKLVLARDTGNPGHDWTTCEEPSCVIARNAIAKAEGR